MRCAPKLVCSYLVLLLAAFHTPGEAQTMRLREVGSNSERLGVRVGQTVNLEVFADLQGKEAAGFSLFVTIPGGSFQVLDTNADVPGTQPFIPGALFAGATPFTNILLPEDDPAAASFPGLQLDYSAVIGTGSNRRRSGSGIVARFSLLCVKPIQNGRLSIDDNPLREARLVLADGRTEQRFRTVQGMEITVSGMELRDIPDVILQPGQTDSIQIGILDNYVGNTLAAIDSIRWSFAPAVLDSVEIQIDPRTRQVSVIPSPGWIGRRRITWTAAEPRGLLPGEEPLSASDVSDIVVNNPPQFVLPADALGVKRDTVRFQEDGFTYIPGAANLDARRAFRGADLDLLVEDPDVLDPQKEFNFAVLSYGNLGDTAGVRGDKDVATHELLLWARPNFAGVDSLRLLVRDAYRGQDSLRVIVLVEEVLDPPRFILKDRNLRISRGGSKSIALESMVADPDTPLDSLLLDWDDDPGGHFTVERVGPDLVFRGKTDFAGSGRFVFRVADPADPENQKDGPLVLNITAAEALPPVVDPDELKVPLTPPGFEPAQPPYALDLDAVVEDPDNQDRELAWSVPSVRRSQILVDEEHAMSVRAPDGFVGYEGVVLTVSDPNQQSGFLKLRVYSSDGRPVIGGMPDLILDRGQQDAFDLDEYYFDADNIDEEMRWEVMVGQSGRFEVGFDGPDLIINVDPLTHIARFIAPPEASFKTETVVFRVTSVPEGVSAQDTMLVTIRSGGDTGSSFLLRALPSLQAPVNQVVEVLDLNEYVETTEDMPKSSIRWAVTRSGVHGTPLISAGNKLKVFGTSSGLDTLVLTATDTLGRAQSASTTLRVYGESEVLKLQAIQDIQFIAGQVFSGLRLNDYVVDRQAHPDSLLSWSVENLGSAETIFVRVNGDSVFAFSTDIAETQVVFVARNTKMGVAGRDTVRVIALDPALAAKPLQDFPPLVLVAGQEDSSIVLNEYLPEGSSSAAARWTVSGQSITSPVIDPKSPHLLHVRTVLNRIGVDSLRFVVDLGGGFTARGNLVVTVVEPVDATTLNLVVVPNVINPHFIDVFVVSRRELAGTPNVVQSFAGGTGSTVAVRQLEADLAKRTVLVWTGSVRLPPDASGQVFFTSQALTALGTPVSDTASVAVATVQAGKPVALTHGGVTLALPADVLVEGTQLLMQVAGGADRDGVAKTADDEHLRLLRRIDLYPAGLELGVPGVLRAAAGGPGEGVYLQGATGWEFAGPTGRGFPITRLAGYGVLWDGQPPQVGFTPVANGGRAEVVDRGSGVDPTSLLATVDGMALPGEYEAPFYTWVWPEQLLAGSHRVGLQVSDRSGNAVAWEQTVAVTRAMLPTRPELGANYPNPFNPATTIPYAVPARQAGQPLVRLAVYSIGGQLVRELVRQASDPGQHQVQWDGCDQAGYRVSSGVYLYRLEVGGAAITRRMTLLK
jgi:hypothetical protein